jgi:hypothetical protein
MEFLLDTAKLLLILVWSFLGNVPAVVELGMKALPTLSR